MARIGLIDVDGHNYPNYALMKISAYHKACGDDVEMYDPMFSKPCNRVYMSKIFTFTQDYAMPIYADEVVRGGTSYDIKSALPTEIEDCGMLDETSIHASPPL